MFDSYISTQDGDRLFCASRGLYAPTRVFLTRQRFETGIVPMLDARESGECAVLHVAVRGDNSSTGSVCRRMLNLVGNTLRVCMRGGAVAYLGDAEFAVLLQDTDARDAEAYARTVITIASGFRVLWQGEMLSAQARIGGILAGTERDGAALLAQAIAAGQAAAVRPAPKLHLVLARDEEIRSARDGRWDGAALQAAG
jgi:hypothetical protein